MRVVRIASVLVAVLCALVVLLDYFITHPALDRAGALLSQWVTLLAAAALVLGLLNLARVHSSRVVGGRSGWQYSLALLGALIVTVFLGFAPGSGGAGDPSVNWIFTYVYQPLSAAVFSLLAFYIASAAYRALRLRSLEAGALLIAAVIVLLGQIPLAARAWDALPQARAWMLAIVGMAGLRGILIGVALGAMLTGLRVLLGLDRPYLDKDQ